MKVRTVKHVIAWGGDAATLDAHDVSITVRWGSARDTIDDVLKAFGGKAIKWERAEDTPIRASTKSATMYEFVDKEMYFVITWADAPHEGTLEESVAQITGTRNGPSRPAPRKPDGLKV